MFNSNYGSVLHQKYCDLEIWVIGYSRLSKLVPFDSLPMVFEMITFEKYRDLETPVIIPSRSGWEMKGLGSSAPATFSSPYLSNFEPLKRADDIGPLLSTCYICDL